MSGARQRVVVLGFAAYALSAAPAWADDPAEAAAQVVEEVAEEATSPEEAAIMTCTLSTFFRALPTSAYADVKTLSSFSAAAPGVQQAMAVAARRCGMFSGLFRLLWKASPELTLTPRAGSCLDRRLTKDSTVLNAIVDGAVPKDDPVFVAAMLKHVQHCAGKAFAAAVEADMDAAL